MRWRAYLSSGRAGASLRSRAVIFVEVLRLIIVLVGALAGLAVANGAHPSPDARVLGATVGVLVGYVIGGAAGRLVNRLSQTATRRWRDVPASEVLPAALLGGLGFL